MLFAASLDKTALVSTVLIAGLFAAIVAVEFATVGKAGLVVPSCTAVGLLLLYLLTFAYRATGYVTTARELIIKRPLADVHIRRADIKRVVALAARDIKGSVRLFGVGGMFGYYGKFANSPLGRMTWYATRRDTPVLVTTTDHRQLILTPDDPAQFVRALAR